MSRSAEQAGAGDDPVLITEAAPSYEEEFAARKRKYALTMGLRFPCLILAGIFHEFPWLAVSLVVIAVPLPWIAVLIANHGPARKAEEVNKYEPEPRAIESTEHRVIDG